MGKHRIKRLATIVVALLSVITLAPLRPAVAAACAAPTVDYGSASSSVTAPEAATYRVWTRMMVPDTTNTTYLLQIDNNGTQTCFTVNGGSTVNTWVWVASQSGTTASRTDIALTKGAHAIKMIGNKPGVKIDRLVFTSDLNCTPNTADGSDCNTPNDTTPPTVDLTSPAAGATVNGNVNVAASASDNVGVTKVEFYIDSTLQNTDTASPYSFQLDTASLTNKAYLLTAKAYDAAGNVGTDSYQITVQNSDQQAPSTPTNVKAVAVAYNKVNVTWNASTDNVGVKSYLVLRNNVPVAEVSTPSYSDTNAQASTTYTYQLQAKDAAGNVSALSPSATVTTSSVADTTAPSKPQNPTIKVIGQSQINVSWSPSTDNVGVKAYDIYRAKAGGTAAKVAEVTSTSFGDNSLEANTSYTYFVKARDAAGNVSPQSDSVTAKTTATTQHSILRGTVRNARTNRPIANALVTIVEQQGHRHTHSTNSNGVYVFRELDAGRYNVAFWAKDYRSKSISVKIDTSRVVRDVTLEKR